ncbi:phosphoribosylanthranilate isomerase [Kitasatospora kifunensis]|uniref:N-(5'-phosphoribosyl)anthranilate isomerase n=1 Tax=Kitasatospora kifunensis TaxID=58351 RepID=A0A7W7VT87_KITKI|nr:hypothetical protein [Kitasatospora kifunensis]MBB4921195.1 indole-3-glycerol phosphate synthase [Kitasatospora kifunensis]
MRLKVCGVTGEDQLRLLAGAPVDLVGLWYGVPGGPADLQLAELAHLAAVARAVGGPEPVLVTLLSDPAALCAAVAASGVSRVQLHGYTTPAQLRAVRAALPEAELLKVLHVRQGRVVESALLEAYQRAGADVFLFDSVGEDGRIGSTGIPLDASAVEAVLPRIDRPFLLAGGVSVAGARAHRAARQHPRFLGIDLDSGARTPDGAFHPGLIREIRAAWQPAPPGLAAALSCARLPVVMELKARSAHGQDLFRGRSATRLVAEYTRAGAPALSVVTGEWFGGSAALLEEVAGATELPILVKDFFTKERQLATARAAGAAAVLLTASVLPRTVLPRLITAALALGLTPFVEITEEAELAAVVHPQACVIAVNNKDIRQREQGRADLTRSLRLLPAVTATGTPVPVSASGIETPQQAAALLAAGYRGLLIGTGLLGSVDLDSWSATLARESELAR